MGWPYHFVDVSEAQKIERRRLLDYYGVLAQLSALVPLLAIQVYFAARWVSRRWRTQPDGSGSSSPRMKSERSMRHSSDPKATFRKLQWWSSSRCTVLGIHLGTNGEVVAAIGWTAWLVVLCFLQTGDDYFHLTKRFGIVASSQIPLHYLLALKSPFAPLQLLTRCSHETLNSSHQILGRIVTLLLYLHAALYINMYVLVGVLGSKLVQLHIICGWLGIIAFTAVGTTALSSVKKWSYRVFYITHVSLATAILPLLYFHVSHLRIYLYETAVIYAINVVTRTLASKTHSGTLKIIPGTDLLDIEIPLARGTSAQQRWQPGQHAYVSLSGHPLLRTFRSNPFTVASMPSIDGRLHFVARVLDGNTAQLAQAASAAKTSLSLTVEGPYGSKTHSERLLRYDKVLFVAGGVGGTFVVPLYRQLLADLSPSKGSYRRQQVSFVWAVRSKAEMSWALPVDANEREGFVERLNIYVTGIGETPSLAANGSLSARSRADEDGEEGIELEERKGLLTDESGEGGELAAHGIPTSTGRPNLAHLVDELFAPGRSHQSVAVVVCGPQSLSQALRKEVGRWVARGRDVWLWDESFAY